MSTSRSLERRSPDDLRGVKESFEAKYPPTVPDAPGVWKPEGDRVKLYDADSSPVEVLTDVAVVAGFFSVTVGNVDEGRVASLQLKFEMERPNDGTVPQTAFWKWATQTFGPDGTMADGIAQNFVALTGKSRPAGVTPKNVKAKVNEDLATTAGKPHFVPQPLKQRTTKPPSDDEDGKPVERFGWKIYLSKEKIAGSPPRAAGTAPKEIEEVFAKHDAGDHPVLQFFRSNPDTVPATHVALTVADGRATPWEIIAAASNKGSKQHYMRFVGSARLGGISFRYLASDRKMFLLGMYANRPGGVKVYGIPVVGQGEEDAEEDNDDVYGKKPMADDGNIYDKAKRRKVE